MGRTTDPRRTAQARHRHQPEGCLRVHGQARSTAVAVLRTFLTNHAKDIVSIDFFTVPTVTFGVIYSMGIKQVRTTKRSSWQNPYDERVIGSIRQEYLDYVIVLNERHLRRVLRDYLDYYHRSRTHLGLEKDCPEHRPVEQSEDGDIHAVPVLGGLHHRYRREAA